MKQEQPMTTRLRIKMMRIEIGAPFSKRKYVKEAYDIIGGDRRSASSIISYTLRKMAEKGEIRQLYPNNYDTFVRNRDIEIPSAYEKRFYNKKAAEKIVIDVVSTLYMFSFGGNFKRMTIDPNNYYQVFKK